MTTVKRTPKKGAGETMPIFFSKVENHAYVTDDLTADEIVELIKGNTYKKVVEKIRKLRAESKTDEADSLKISMQGFTGSGKFSGRRNRKSIEKYSKIVVLDFDKLSHDRLEHFLSLINENPYTYISFISVSGCGIKVVVKVSSSLEDHTTAYQQVLNYYEDLLGVKADKGTSDLARLCYFSHDKNIYYNKNAEVFPVNLPTSESNIVNQENLTGAEHLFNEAVNTTNKIRTLIPGQRNNYIHVLACNCNRKGILLEDAIRYIQFRINHGLPESEVISSINSAYSNNAKEFGIWSSNKSNAPLAETLENALRKVLSEFFSPKQQ